MMLPSASGRLRETSTGEETCSATERGSIRAPPGVASESEVTDMDEAGRHQERRREEAERHREAEKKRREQIRREKVENGARAFAAEQDRAIKELISHARALTMDIEDFLMAVEDVLHGRFREKR
jgi:transposase